MRSVRPSRLDYIKASGGLAKLSLRERGDSLVIDRDAQPKFAAVHLPESHPRPKYLLTSIQPGLFFRSRLPLLDAMSALGWEVHVAMPETLAWKDALEERGMNIHEIRLHRGSTHPMRELETLRDFRQIVKHVKPQLSHHFSSKAVIYGSLAGSGIQISTLTGIGFSLVGAGTIRERLPTRLLAPLLYRAALKRNAQVIFQNEDDRTEFMKRRLVRSGSTRLLPGSGVDMEYYHPTQRAENPGPTRFTLLARMIREKGVVEFVEAARILSVKHPGKFEFCLCGPLDPQNPSALNRSEIEAWVDSGVVSWLKDVPDGVEAYRHSAVAVLPSYHEGLPRALVEASAMGLPVISTDTRGCRDVVVDGITGVLVPVRNVQSLADAMERLGLDPQLRNRYGTEGRSHVESRYGVDRIVRETLDIYRRELANREMALDHSEPAHVTMTPA